MLSHLSRENFLYLISILGIVFFSYLLINPELVSRAVRLGDLAPKTIGSVTSAQNDTRKRSASSLTWYNLYIQQDIFNNDKVFTGPSSFVDLNLQKNLIVNIQPNTLLHINFVDEKFNLELSSGQFKLKSIGAPQIVNLKSGQQHVQIKINKETNVIVPETANDSLRIYSPDGDVPIKIIGSNEEFVVKKNESIDIAENASINKSIYEITQLAPLYNEIIYTRNDSTVPFEWSGAESNSSLYITDDLTLLDTDQIVSSNPRITKINTSDMNYSWPTRGKSGTFYWKVVSGKNISAINMFTLFEIRAPEFIYPANNDLISTDSRLIFSWIKSPGIERHIVEVYKSDRKNLIFSESTFTKNNMTLSILPDKYAWRIGAIYQDNIKWSDFATFSVQPRNQNDLPLSQNLIFTDKSVESQSPILSTAPQAIGPFGTININDFEKNGYYASIKFDWAGDSKDYAFEISENRDFSNPFLSAITSQSFYNWIQALPGNYFWRVRKHTTENDKNEWSKNSIILITNTPELKVTYDKSTSYQNIKAYENGTNSVAINWNQAPFTHAYKIDIARSDKFNSFKSIITKKTSAKISVQEGVTFFRLSCLDQYEKTVCPYSNTLNATLKKELNLVPPIGLAPGEGVYIVSLGDSESPIAFRWRTIERGYIYQIQVSDSQNFSNILFQTDTIKNTAVFVTDIKKKKIFWRVRSTYKSFFSQWSKIYSFNL